MVTAEEFVKAWQSAGSAREVATATKTTLSGVNSRAARYREMGVPLKAFPKRDRVLNIKLLQRLAKEAESGRAHASH